MDINHSSRRPIAARSTQWAKNMSAVLARADVTPNQISVASIGFAILGAAALLGQVHWPGLVACAVCIQGRLVCNLLDGMVAIEGGKQSALGVIYNEFPDRIADSVLIVALGYATPYPALGWLGALAAALTAYIRVFGGSLGLVQDFRGPMAKQHRMAVMTIGCLSGAVESLVLGSHVALLVSVVIIAVGSLVTCITRTLAISAQLKVHA